MPYRTLLAALATLALAFLPTPSAAGDASPLTDADRRAFAFFDGIGLPSCAGKPYVRLHWVRQGAPQDLPARDDVWELDGFIVAEHEGLMTVLDGDLWTRKVGREPAQGWTGEVLALDLAEIGEAATSRLRALVEDPGAVEPASDLFRGIRLRIGEEGRALALARHCAENDLEREAHELLLAARALPRPIGARPGAPVEELAARQIDEPVIWRIVYDFADEDVSRAALLERLRGWRRSFPASSHVARADALLRVLEPMVAEDAAHAALTEAELAALPPEQRARELVFRLRDQTGDVTMSWNGRVSIDTGGRDTPAGRLVAMGAAAAPALVDALTDARLTRAVLFRYDETFSRQVVARVGDLARVALERIAGTSFWEVPRDRPSMFQHDAAPQVQEHWRAWLAPRRGFVEHLAALARETDPERRAELLASLPDRGTGPLPGATDAVWGRKRFTAAVEGLDEDAARDLLRRLLAGAPHPRTRALAAWALLDLGEPGVVADVATLWRSMGDDTRADPEQGGAVASFLAACGDPAGIAALVDGLDERPAAVREIAVLAFAGGGLGAVRGFAADRPDGIVERWPSDEALLAAAEALLAARLGDLEKDPLGLIPRQTPLCDMVPEYDSGYRIADAVVRVLARRWPSRYSAPDEPVRTDEQWEALRERFLDAWQTEHAPKEHR